MTTLFPLKTFVLATALVLASTAAQAGSLENLERERAILVDTIFAPDLTPDERQKKIAQSKHRLVDLERMAIRDKTLEGQNTPVVRRAFASYDLTFLVHASVEKDRGITDHWLDTVGLSTDSLMNARVGRRY
ncbi:hypothetical protein JCM17960_00350 [Magnetospira thiophila]